VAKKKKKQEHFLEQNKPILSKLALWAWIFAIAGVCISFAIFFGTSMTKMPDTESMENPDYEYATIIYSDKNQELGRAFSKNRQWKDYEDISPFVVDALVATEDIRFFDHSGIDLRGTLRAIAHLGTKGGASTITQQMSKLFYTDHSRNKIKRLFQKFREWSIAIEFERRYTKEEIIAMFLNEFEFINGAIGISTAAETYFNKDQKDLTLEEAAMLVGMLKNPYIFNPIQNPENAMKRREVVLKQMVRAEMISDVEYDSLRVIPFNSANYQRQDHIKGPAPYFRMELVKWLRNELKKPEHAKADGTAYNLYRDGLRIYTTIDLEMQKHAEAELKNHMNKVQAKYFNLWDKVDPWSEDADERMRPLRLTEEQKNIRKGSLTNLIYESDRYLKLRDRYLRQTSKDITSQIDNVKLRDIDIKRMIREKKEGGYLNRLLKDKLISSRQKTGYLEVIESEYFNNLVNDWNKLQRAAKEAFSKKVSMNVFAYTPSGEKRVTMSPLDSIKYHRKHLQLGSVAMDPATGHVKTWVGGIGFKYFKYDHIGSNRQVGSTFKPFIYTTAIQQGYSPCYPVIDQQYVIDKSDPSFNVSKTWAPKNARGKFTGEKMTLLEGLRTSTNSVSVWLMKQIGNVERVRDVVETMGISKDKIPPYPAICIGSADLNVMEMTSAYSVFANNGIYTSPTIVKRIEDKDGKTIWQPKPERRRALNEKYNHAMVEMLQYNMAKHQYKIQTNFGGKTGTTNDHVDAWFMGITPNLVVGTWVGGDDPWIRFTDLTNGQGAVMARPFFTGFMKRIESDPTINFNTTASFSIPEVDRIELDCERYNQLNQPTTEKPSEFFDEDEFEEGD